MKFVPVVDGLVELVDQGLVVEGRKAAHDASLLVLKRHVLGPDRHRETVAVDDAPFLRGARLSVGYGILQQADVPGTLGVEQIGTGQPQDFAAVVAGNPFGRRVEKGDQPPAIDREDADVDAV